MTIRLLRRVVCFGLLATPGACGTTKKYFHPLAETLPAPIPAFYVLFK
jgi:hypothetical protein